MSRISKAPISVPKGVEVTIEDGAITVKGKGGTLSQTLHQDVSVQRVEDVLQCSANEASMKGEALAGTTRALVQNMVTGVSDGFERKLQLIGIGYRAQMKGSTLNSSAWVLASHRLSRARRCLHRDAVADRDCRQGHRQAARRPNRGDHTRLPSTRAV